MCLMATDKRSNDLRGEVVPSKGTQSKGEEKRMRRRWSGLKQLKTGTRSELRFSFVLSFLFPRRFVPFVVSVSVLRWMLSKMKLLTSCGFLLLIWRSSEQRSSAPSFRLVCLRPNSQFLPRCPKDKRRSLLLSREGKVPSFDHDGRQRVMMSFPTLMDDERRNPQCRLSHAMSPTRAVCLLLGWL